MRTVLSTPRRPSFRLGFTPAAQAQFQAARTAVGEVYDRVRNSLDIIYPDNAGNPQMTTWDASLTSLLDEVDALTLAATASEDSGLASMISSLQSVGQRMETLSGQWTGVRRYNAPSEVAHRGFMYGALAIVMGLGVGFAYISYSKRA